MTAIDSKLATGQITPHQIAPHDPPPSQLDFLTLESLEHQPSSPDIRQRLLRFRLGAEESGLLPLEDIAEVLQIPLASILPVPGVPEAVLGLCNWRGNMLWLVDLNTLTGYPPLLEKARLTSLVVLVVQIQGSTVGLGVSQFDDIELHSLDHLQPVAPGLFPAEIYPFIAGVLPEDQGAVLNASSIIQNLPWQTAREAQP